MSPDILNCITRTRWWLALPVMLPLWVGVKLADWTGDKLHAISRRVWGWAFGGGR